MTKIGVLGGGAWGTALAAAACRAGSEVLVQAREPEVVEAINTGHVNSLFLPDAGLDPRIRATTAVTEAVDADVVLVVTPAQHLREALEGVAGQWPKDVPAVICSKGIEQGTCALMSEIAAEALPEAPVAILSGPTFAIEVALDRPTAVTVASQSAGVNDRVIPALSSSRFRIYGSDDVIGAQVGGAVKNVLAIACGIVEGRKLGDNARAALITRGLAEIVRLGAAKGARPETLSGLSGFGDLTLTCNAMQSRNFSLGVALGEGQGLDEIVGSRNSIAEGVFTASSVTELARRLGVEVPICTAVDGVINHFAAIDATIESLLSRPLKDETD